MAHPCPTCLLQAALTVFTTNPPNILVAALQYRAVRMEFPPHSNTSEVQALVSMDASKLFIYKHYVTSIHDSWTKNLLHITAVIFGKPLADIHWSKTPKSFRMTQKE